MATKTAKLSEAQQQAIIELYQNGVTKYTDIQKKLKLPYILINKFMTKWKAQHGVLKARAEAKAETPEITLTDRPTQISLSEYQFLKNFYMERRMKEVLKQDMGKANNA